MTVVSTAKKINSSGGRCERTGVCPSLGSSRLQALCYFAAHKILRRRRWRVSVLSLSYSLFRSGAMFDCSTVVDRRPAGIIITHPGNLATDWKKATPSRGCYLPDAMRELLSHGHRAAGSFVYWTLCVSALETREKKKERSCGMDRNKLQRWEREKLSTVPKLIARTMPLIMCLAGVEFKIPRA